MSFDLPSLPSGWTYSSLETCARKQSISYGVVQPGAALEAGVPIIRVNNFKDGRIDIDDLMKISPEIESKYARTRLIGGEVLITLVGSVGQVAVAPKTVSGFNVARAVAVIHPEDHVSPNWIAICLRSPLSQHLLASRANTTVQTTINLKDLRALPLPLPPIDEREQIDNFITALDDRIALLRETNATLEAIAQALFKSWFVDFDPVHANAGTQAPSLPPEIQALFPATFTDSPQGPIPEGWNVGAIKLACQKVESGGTPKRSVPEYWSGDIPWLSSGEVRNPIVLDTKETISQLGVKESSAKLWPAGSTIVAMYGATAGEVCILAKSSTANQACCGLIPKSNTRSFVFFCIRRESENLAAKSSGSAQQNLNKGLVESHEVIQPTSEVLTAFEDRMGALLDSWIENEKKAQTLSSLRDTLLPRLISGQLRLPEAEQAISAITV